MALSKVTYVDGSTVIHAQNLNDIQDEILRNASNISTNTSKINGLISDSTASGTTHTWSINKIKSAITELINDAQATGTAKTWSINKIKAEIANAISALGQVKKVNNQSPDTAGNVALDASKINVDDSATTKVSIKQAIEDIANPQIILGTDSDGKFCILTKE